MPGRPAKVWPRCVGPREWAEERGADETHEEDDGEEDYPNSSLLLCVRVSRGGPLGYLYRPRLCRCAVWIEAVRPADSDGRLPAQACVRGPAIKLLDVVGGTHLFSECSEFDQHFGVSGFGSMACQGLGSCELLQELRIIQTGSRSCSRFC